MFRVSNKPTHKFIARIPELNYYLLRNVGTNKLELWTQSRGIQLQAIQLDNMELEFVRDVVRASRVMDNTFNRQHRPDDIGRVYVDSIPNTIHGKEL